MKGKKSIFTSLQKLGPAMLPAIAIMPLAGFVYSLGIIMTEPGVVEMIPFLATPFVASFAGVLFGIGSFIMSNLHILFAISVAIGFTKNDGVAGLSAAVAFFTMNKAIEKIKCVTPEMVATDWSNYTSVLGINTLNMGVAGGIIVGCMVAWLFNKYKDIKLPTVISFFQGKRFIPIVSIFGSVLLALILSVVWPYCQQFINFLGSTLAASSTNFLLGIFLFSVIIRLLLPLGLHQVIWIPMAYQLGTWVNSSGEVFNGYYPIYFAQLADGISTPDVFPAISGNYFAPFCYCALGLAFIYTAKKENKDRVKSQMIPAMLTGLLTGISEPIEFSYLFQCFPLYIFQSVFMAASACFIPYLIKFTLGSGSWGGLLDFILYGPIQGNPTWWKLLIAGPALTAVYAAILIFLIKKFNIKTPGREDEVEEVVSGESVVLDKEYTLKVIAALGGKENLEEVDACVTRLRCHLIEASKIDEKALKLLGSQGVLKIGNDIQVIFGEKAILLKNQINNILEGKEVQTINVKNSTNTYAENEIVVSPAKGKLIELSKVSDRIFAEGMVGCGFAIEPKENTIVSPINGRVTSIFPTKHAISLLTDTGIEVLVHMGIDTSKMKEDAFKINVKPDEIVSTGTVLADMDLEKIKKSGYENTICVVFTNIPDNDIKVLKNGSVDKGEENIVEICKK